MSRILSKAKRRFWVVFNYASVCVFIVLFLLGEYTSWDAALTIATILSFILIVISFIFLFVRTGLWKLALRALNEGESPHLPSRHSKRLCWVESPVLFSPGRP